MTLEVEQRVGKVVSEDYLWDLFHCNGWKKKCPVRIILNEALSNKLSLKKLHEKLESVSIAFPAMLQNLPVVVFFEDEARFGRLSREMACWVKGKTVTCVAKQLIREYIHAYSALSPQTGDCYSMISPVCNTASMNEFLQQLLTQYSELYYCLIKPDGIPANL